MSKHHSFINKYWSLLLTGLFVLLLMLAYFFIDPFGAFIREAWQVLMSEDPERISNYFNEFGFWGPIAIIILMILQMFLIIFPSWLPMIVAVMIYGFLPGALISITGVILASSVGFFLGIKLGTAALEKMISKKKCEKMNYWVENYGFWSVVLFRISPFLSNDAISFVAGMLNMDYRKFIIATFIGIIPLVIAIAYFAKDTDTMKTGLYWIGGAGLFFYGIYIYIDNKNKKHYQR